MSDIETPVDHELDDTEELPAADEVDIEAPEADAAEQHTPVGGQHRYAFASVPPDVDPADAADQQREVELDDDDYR